MGLNWRSLGFSHNQNDRGSSGVYIICIYCGLSMKINTRKMPHSMQRSWTHLYCVCFCVCGRQKPEDPQFEPHGWRCHYTGHYRRSGISRVYLWLLSINAWLSKLYHVMPMKCPCYTHKLYMWYVHSVHVIFTGAHMVSCLKHAITWHTWKTIGCFSQYWKVNGWCQAWLTNAALY